MAFDSVLDLANKEDNCHTLCYADDTLLIVTGLNVTHTRLRAGVFVTRVINRINSLDLDIAADKTEALFFHPRGMVELPRSTMVGDILVNIKPSMKYLGILVDVRWKFSEHFR